MENETIIIVSVFGAAWVVLFLMAVVLFVQVASLKRRVSDMKTTGRLRVQKLKMNNDKNHAFHNPGLVPDEELSRRGFAMYAPDDVEANTGSRPDPYRQTDGHFVEELTRELDTRHQKQSTAPPFLLQSIEENKRKGRNYNNLTNSRQSQTNPNFIY
ncbi:uncharacterized protein LOC113509152 [Galleria mellonella]|uniref:Uncharacterized protein LOC113509152 n=1 Tax=Galleria mellonella TaxID=7137 RepID=A0ABM3MW89_GALME|nr:uncharacterized protein LOC113509152 [Galleria mellonella]